MTIKPGLVLTAMQSNWASCRSIMPNLAAAYEGQAGLQIFSYNMDSTPHEILKTAFAIRAAQVTHLSFIDHMKHPDQLLQALDVVYEGQEWPELLFHVYGDFTLFTAKWLLIEPFIKNRKLKFVCSSPRQAALIQSFLQSAAVAVCPFPVSETEFGFDATVRAQHRKSLGYENDFVVLYSGRLSLQKNVLSLIKEVTSACHHGGWPFQLLLAGPCDDIGSPFFGMKQTPGAYQRSLQTQLQRLPEEYRHRVHLLGSLPKEELRRIYNVADVYVSFSTHHDEDYGMAPAEALMSGCPTILSDWGGFNGFQKDESCSLLPITLSGRGPQIHLNQFGPYLEKYFKTSQDMSVREHRAQVYSSYFGIQGVSQIVGRLLQDPVEPFLGFSDNLKIHAQLSRLMPLKGSLFQMGEDVDPHYRMFYKHYSGEEASV